MPPNTSTSQVFHLSVELSGALERECHAECVSTPFALLAAMAALFHRHSKNAVFWRGGSEPDESHWHDGHADEYDGDHALTVSADLSFRCDKAAT